jgi:hypothetical protein
MCSCHCLDRMGFALTVCIDTTEEFPCRVFELVMLAGIFVVGLRSVDMRFICSVDFLCFSVNLFVLG